MTPAWQKRRSRFNHDWLKNQFLPALASWLNLLDDKIEDPGFEQSFMAAVLPQWEAHHVEALDLVRDFEELMSPAGLLDRPPLVRLSEYDRSWLRKLVHGLWLGRYAVPKLVANALDHILAVDRAYELVQQRLRSCPGTQSVYSERPFRSDWKEFRELCLQLAKAIEAFPGEVKAT